MGTKIKLELLNGPGANSTCHHIAVRNYDTNELLAYTHEFDLFTEMDEAPLVVSIKKTTTKLSTKTVEEAINAVNGKLFEATK